MTKANKKRFPGMKIKPRIGAPKKVNNWKPWRMRKYGVEEYHYLGRAMDLKELHKQILLYIRIHQHENRFSPNTNKIARDFGIAKETALRALISLRDKGYIEIDGPSNATQILFPKGVQFPWEDYKQFPIDIFSRREPFNYIPPPPLPDVANPRKKR